jgi:hypothetical protein
MDISSSVLSQFLAYHIDLGGDVVALLDLIHAPSPRARARCWSASCLVNPCTILVILCE